jgi:hypothetical protein
MEIFENVADFCVGRKFRGKGDDGLFVCLDCVTIGDLDGWAGSSVLNVDAVRFGIGGKVVAGGACI